MSYKVEDLGKNMTKLTIEVPAEDLEKALEKAYQKNKGKMNIQGFRKGKAPRAIIEKMYGPAVFYEDAANELINEAYPVAAEESGLDIVSRPEIDVEQIEKGKAFIFTATVAVKPEVTLGEYKGIEVEVEKAEVTDEEVNAELDKVRDQNSRMVTIEDRPVENGDIAVIDYEGFCDGVAFAGGKGTDHALTIGSHSFIDTFEEQLIGKNIGEEVDVNVTFPEEYHAPELAGKPALFKVTIKKINKKELPELDDEFAQEASEFDTLDEYKADIKASLLEKKADAAKAKKEDAVVDKIIENATMEIPEPMIESKKYQMAEDYAQRLQASGLSIDQYFKFTGMTVESFMETLAPQALKAIQYRLVLEAVVKAENIVISDEEIDAEMQKLADAYKMELDKVKEIITGKEKDEFVMDIAVRKAIDVVRDAAVEK